MAPPGPPIEPLLSVLQDSVAGPKKLRQKAMAKSTATSLCVLVLQSRPADHYTMWLINTCLASVFA